MKSIKAIVVKLILISSFLTSLALGQDVSAEHAKEMKAGTELFKNQVRAILVKQCLNCHGGEEVEAEFNIATREGLLKGGESKSPAVIPGKSHASFLMKLIRHQQEPEMPQDAPKLSADVVSAIAKWIDLGAPYDQPLVDGAGQDDWTRREIDNSLREYWAFQPLVKSDPPHSKFDDQRQNEIDGYVFKKQQEIGTDPNPPANDRVHIRRLYLDLLGMPPTQKETKAYLSNSDPRKYTKLIDKLLDDTRFGERWARHWLDVARFAESHGFEHDYDRPHAFHYRDFVIKALNQDLPFDKFVRWQIAGDEFEPDNPLAMMATGFLGAGVYPTQITAKEVERVRYDALDDMVATVGTGMLGMTIGCARCHDHKFDPIPQADYYRMLSTFTKTVRSNVSIPIKPIDQNEHQKYVSLQKQLAEDLSKYDSEKLPVAFAAWDAQRDQTPIARGWTEAPIVDFKSEGGATLKKLADGSVLASGKNPKFDTYQVVVQTDVKGITAIKLETLADKSLPRGGPGRAGNGNFALSNLKVFASPNNGKGETVEVEFQRAKATYDRKAMESFRAIDDDPRSAWALDPHIGKDHFAVFETKNDISFEGGTKLAIEMRFNNNTGHNFGRFRIGVTSSARPVELELKGPPAEIATLLNVASTKRTQPQQQKLVKWFTTLDPVRRQLQQKLTAHESTKPAAESAMVMVSSEGVKAIRHHTQGGDFLAETHYLKRGDADQKVRPASQNVLQVLVRHPDGFSHWQEQPPTGSKTSYQRRSMANWITDAEYGAGHLMARVIVNRLWHHHFGRGLVTTPNDFGRQSEPPSHPELLDFLALKLIENQWSLKSIHRLILQSATYRQSSDFDLKKHESDPDNISLWRFQPRRLEAEAIRDSFLNVSGLLDSSMYGAGTLNQNMLRRSIYFTVKRSRLIPMMTLFDAPEPLGSIGRRDATTIAPQALLFINSPQVRKAAEALAAKIDTPEYSDVVNAGYQQTLNRPATDTEIEKTVQFLKQQESSYNESKKPNARQLAITDFCQNLFSLNEFIYLR